MGSSIDERTAREDFSARYGRPPSDVLDGIESRVIGGAWGANGFSTVSQADLIGERLRLGPDRRLLDIGTGRGWPGLYLSHRTGCEVVLADLPIEGIHIALDRAGRDNLPCVGGVVASARHLPFAPGSFEAIVHTDVLC